MSNIYLNEKLRSVIDLDKYHNDGFSIGDDFAMEAVGDNLMLVEYLDTHDGRDVMRRGIVIPSAHVQKAWRFGRVILAGPNVKYFSAGDCVCFPNDKGIPVSNIKVKIGEEYVTVKNATFLDEPRIFGKVSPVPQDPVPTETLESMARDGAIPRLSHTMLPSKTVCSRCGTEPSGCTC